MIDTLLHECGIALVRLRKPLSFYIKKYGASYAMTRMCILMEKQHNRGQDGAGIANIKIDQKPGLRYIDRRRSVKHQPIADLFNKIGKQYRKGKKKAMGRWDDEIWLKENVPFTGELWLGHLRYGTHGLNGIESVQPLMRQNNWRSRNLVIAGNFNMTNVDGLFDLLIGLGQHPKEKVDTVTVMEKIGHFLDEDVQKLFKKYKNKFDNVTISNIIENEINFHYILQKACQDFDGGYVIAGLTGSGSAFVVRDPSGIRPAYYYADDEIVVVASEKPAIKTAFNIRYDQIEEIEHGSALVIEKNGTFYQRSIMKQLEKKSCSFERIYFSRGTDPEIYRERKQLGNLLAPAVLKAIEFDLHNTVFSYIPNTAETAFLGMIENIEKYLTEGEKKKIINNGASSTKIHERNLFPRPRVEKIVFKDTVLRTFITNDQEREEMVAHAYDTTYEVVNKGQDTLVVIDDSIVRGTTLERSVLKILDRLEPKKIIVVSSAPQIRFPDCYGIDMSRMHEFVAFRAMMQLIKDIDPDHPLLAEVYDLCRKSEKESRPKNYVKRLYKLFTHEQISDKIADIIRPDDMQAELQVIFQTIGNLHKAIPNHRGDWYFTGNYPTKGGFIVANRSFVQYMEGKRVRAY